MASGTSYEFSIPKFKPVHMLDGKFKLLLITSSRRF